LDVQAQGGTPCLWALVDPHAPQVERLFLVYGTGHDVPDDPGMYYGTIHFHSTPPLVFHVFEEDVVRGMRRLSSEAVQSSHVVLPGEEE